MNRLVINAISIFLIVFISCFESNADTPIGALPDGGVVSAEINSTQSNGNTTLTASLKFFSVLGFNTSQVDIYSTSFMFPEFSQSLTIKDLIILSDGSIAVLIQNDLSDFFINPGAKSVAYYLGFYNADGTEKTPGTNVFSVAGTLGVGPAEMVELPNGNIVISYHLPVDIAGIPETQLYYKIFSPTGVQVLGQTDGSTSQLNEKNSELILSGDGGFAIAWSSTDTNKVLWRRFDADGAPVGAEIIVEVPYVSGEMFNESGIGDFSLNNTGNPALTVKSITTTTYSPRHDLNIYSNTGVLVSSSYIAEGSLPWLIITAFEMVQLTNANFALFTKWYDPLGVNYISMTVRSETGNSITAATYGLGNQTNVDYWPIETSDGRIALSFSEGGVTKVIFPEEFDTRSATLTGTPQKDVIVGHDTDPARRDNIIDLLADDDTAYGLGGDDLIYGREGNDLILGGDGMDTLIGGPGLDTLYGEADNDQLVGEAGTDTIVGGDGDDYGYGGDDTDYIYGGPGHDVLLGEGGLDVLVGDAGNDTLFGGPSMDVLYGGDDNDILHGEAGIDILNAGDGNDYLYGGDERDFLNGNNGNDIMFGGEGSDIAIGGAGIDTIQGDGGNDYIYGGDDNDVLRGGEGVDIIQGQNGNDYIDGGLGVNYLYGGANTDKFVHSEAGVDVIQDFVQGEDSIEFTSGGFSDLADILAASTDKGSYTIITVPGNGSVWLIGLRPSQFTAADFGL